MSYKEIGAERRLKIDRASEAPQGLAPEPKISPSGQSFEKRKASFEKKKTSSFGLLRKSSVKELAGKTKRAMYFSVVNYNMHYAFAGDTTDLRASTKATKRSKALASATLLSIQDVFLTTLNSFLLIMICVTLALLFLSYTGSEIATQVA